MVIGSAIARLPDDFNDEDIGTLKGCFYVDIFCIWRACFPYCVLPESLWEYTRGNVISQTEGGTMKKCEECIKKDRTPVAQDNMRITIAAPFKYLVVYS